MVLGLIQLMAAAEAGRDVVFFTFDDERLMNELYSMHSILVTHKVKVGKEILAAQNFFIH